MFASPSLSVSFVAGFLAAGGFGDFVCGFCVDGGGFELEELEELEDLGGDDPFVKGAVIACTDLIGLDEGLDFFSLGCRTSPLESDFAAGFDAFFSPGTSSSRLRLPAIGAETDELLLLLVLLPDFLGMRDFAGGGVGNCIDVMSAHARTHRSVQDQIHVS